MFDMTFLKESLARRWYVVLVVTLLFAALGVWIALPRDAQGAATSRYSAEATLYVSVDYPTDEAEGYVYSTEIGYALPDVRRAVLSDTVAGAVRDELGEDVTIYSPFWKNSETQAAITTRYIAVDATANTQETAVRAAQRAAELTVQTYDGFADHVHVQVFEDAAPVETDATDANDFGANPLTISSATAVASGISWKRVIALTLVGLVVGGLLVAMVEYARRRLRTEHDVESMLGVPVLGTVTAAAPSDPELGRIACACELRMRANDAKGVALCGFGREDLPDGLATRLAAALPGVTGTSRVLGADADVKAIADADVLLIVVRSGADSHKDVCAAARQLRILGVPALGAVLLA